MKEHEEDFGHFHALSLEIRNKHKNPSVAAENPKVYHDAYPLKLLELLMAGGVDDTRTTLS